MFPSYPPAQYGCGVEARPGRRRSAGHARVRDVGSFAALHEVLPQDEAGNARVGTVVVADSTGNLLVNTDPDSVLAVVGLHDLVVVRTADATLAATLAASQQVKSLAEQVSAEVSPELA